MRAENLIGANRQDAQQPFGKVEAVVGWGYRTTGFVPARTSSPIPPPQNDFGYFWLTAECARVEQGDSIFLYRDGQLYVVDRSSQRARLVEDEEADVPLIFGGIEGSGPWLGALLAPEVGRLSRRVASERIGSLVCRRIEWANPRFTERAWQYQLRQGVVLVRYEAVYKDKANGFVVLAGLLEPRIERVSHDLFAMPSL